MYYALKLEHTNMMWLMKSVVMMQPALIIGAGTHRTQGNGMRVYGGGGWDMRWEDMQEDGRWWDMRSDGSSRKETNIEDANRDDACICACICAWQLHMYEHLHSHVLIHSCVHVYVHHHVCVTLAYVYEHSHSHGLVQPCVWETNNYTSVCFCFVPKSVHQII